LKLFYCFVANLQPLYDVSGIHVSILVEIVAFSSNNSYFRFPKKLKSLRPDYSHKLFTDERTSYIFLVIALAVDIAA